MLLKEMNTSMHEVLHKCEETVNSFRKKKKLGHVFKRMVLSIRLVQFNFYLHDSYMVINFNVYLYSQ
jgi:hypothetical protein